MPSRVGSEPRAASELDEVGGTIGRAGQFGKRDGGFAPLALPKNEKEIPKKRACIENFKKPFQKKNNGIYAERRKRECNCAVMVEDFERNGWVKTD
ncbi:MAG: hypothetical protein WBD95_20480 [Xanthobacteraceae bacterium]